MKYLLVVVALVTPAACWSQGQLPTHVAKAPQKSTIPNSINPRFLSVGPGAFLYRHLQDTVTQPHLRLATGNST
jgi:hypothetical protein